YSAAVAATDTGVIERNRMTARLTMLVGRIIRLKPSSPCLDYGGGAGVLVRMMRDAGFNFHWNDRYATNVYAVGFSGEPSAPYELVTAFEVFEHLVAVQEEIATLLASKPRCVLIGTTLHNGFDPHWAYLS